jgi:4-hydroxybenzoate polyprenyltransferase
MMNMLRQIVYLIRLDKPIGTFLLLFPTLWGLWLAAQGIPDATISSIFIMGVFLMRSAGCIMNDLADRKFDRHVLRTRNRPLANNTLSVKTAIITLILFVSIAFLLIQPLNLLTFKLAFVGLFLAIIYPFLKRVTHLPQVGLGLAFAFGIPMSFAAIRDTIPSEAWLLYAAAVVWPIIYDTQYAMIDLEDDKKISVKSTALLFGDKVMPAIVLLQSVFVALLLFVGFAFHLRAPFYLSLLWVVLCFCYQLILLKQRNKEAYYNAFKSNQWIGLIIFLGCAL